MLNKIQIIGHLGGDTEQSQVGDTSVTKFSVAVTDKWKDKSGNKQEHTEWCSVEAWGKLGEICSEYLHKGKQVYIEGKLKTDQWEDSEGNKKYKTKVVASNMQMLGSKSDSPESGGNEPSQVAGVDDIDSPPF